MKLVIILISCVLISGCICDEDSSLSSPGRDRILAGDEYLLIEVVNETCDIFETDTHPIYNPVGSGIDRVMGVSMNLSCKVTNMTKKNIKVGWFHRQYIFRDAYCATRDFQGRFHKYNTLLPVYHANWDRYDVLKDDEATIVSGMTSTWKINEVRFFSPARYVLNFNLNWEFGPRDFLFYGAFIKDSTSGAWRKADGVPVRLNTTRFRLNRLDFVHKISESDD